MWNTTGLEPGPYQIGVWARQHGSTTAYEAFAIITFQLSFTGNPCTTLALFPSKDTSVNDITSQPPQPTGVTITWRATTTGCPSTLYQFYLAAPWSSFYIVQPYSTGANFSWNTAGLPSGTYRVLVLAKQGGSTSGFEVFAVSTFMLV